MDFRLKISIVFLLQIPICAFAQMSEGQYPYQIVDSIIISDKREALLIESKTCVSNFTPFRESQLYLFKIFEHYYSPGINTNFDMEKGEIKFNISKEDKVLLKELNEIKHDYDQYHQTELVGCFQNNTKDTLLIPDKYNNVIAILEAQDSLKNWFPIQYCLDSHYGIGDHLVGAKIAPNQSILFSVNNYFGKIKTKMRLRMVGNDTIYISNEFNGTIDKKTSKLPLKLDNIEYNDSTIFLIYPIFGNIDNINDEAEIMINEENE